MSLVYNQLFCGLLVVQQKVTKIMVYKSGFINFCQLKVILSILFYFLLYHWVFLLLITSMLKICDQTALYAILNRLDPSACPDLTIVGQVLNCSRTGPRFRVNLMKWKWFISMKLETPSQNSRHFV